MLAALVTELESAGVELRLAQVRGPVRDRMRRTGLMDLIGEKRWFSSNELAVAAPFADRAAPAGDPPAGEPPPDAVRPPRGRRGAGGPLTEPLAGPDRDPGHDSDGDGCQS